MLILTLIIILTLVSHHSVYIIVVIESIYPHKRIATKKAQN